MKRSIAFLSLVILPFLTGCAGWNEMMGGLRTLPPPSMETSIQPGQVVTHVNLNLQQVAARINSETYLMQRVDQGEGFVRIWGRYTQINSTQGGKEFRLRPSGWVTGARYRYNGSDWREIGRGAWAFWLENARDNGQHPLEVQVTYEIWTQGQKTVGTAPLDPFWVANMGD